MNINSKIAVLEVKVDDHDQLFVTFKEFSRNVVEMKVQLAQIPGVSASTADIILAEYSNLVNLINTYQQISIDNLGERELLLATLQMTPKRKLGKVLSTRIYNYLFNNEN